MHVEDRDRARLVLADDHEETRILLRTLLSLHPQIEIVGEAEDGEQAARLALAHDADIVLLDVEMPRMDGFTAAELIRGVRPQARVILHTALANPVKEVRARELGLRLLVKGDFEATIEAVTARLEDVRERGEPLEGGLETLILSAFAGRAAEAVIVINAEQSVSFYSQAAARLLDLPLPAQRLTLAELRRHHPLFDLEAAELERNPIAAALQRKEPAVAELSDPLPGGGLRTYRVQSVPVFDAGRYLGLVSYMTVLREQPPAA